MSVRAAAEAAARSQPRRWRRVPARGGPATDADVGRLRGSRSRHALDDLGQLGRQPGEIRRLGGEPDEDVDHGLALIRRVASGGEEHGGAEREDVAGRRRLPGVPGLLGRHVGGRADAAAGHRELDALGRARDAEVDDARAVRRHEHVRRLQVPVHEADAVDRLQRFGAAGRQPAHGRRPRAGRTCGPACSATAPARTPSPATGRRPRSRRRRRPR